jgi:hypothetical protein
MSSAGSSVGTPVNLSLQHPRVAIRSTAFATGIDRGLEFARLVGRTRPQIGFGGDGGRAIAARVAL